MSKVMLVDDAKVMLKTGKMFLEAGGYEVITVEDGFTALAAIQDTNPDLILLDIEMPRLNGYETCSMIKANEKFKDTPIIMLSSKDGPFDKAKGKMFGCDDYITKPFRKDNLLETVGKHLSQVKSRDAE